MNVTLKPALMPVPYTNHFFLDRGHSCPLWRFFCCPHNSRGGQEGPMSLGFESTGMHEDRGFAPEGSCGTARPAVGYSLRIKSKPRKATAWQSVAHQARRCAIQVAAGLPGPQFGYSSRIKSKPGKATAWQSVAHQARTYPRKGLASRVRDDDGEIRVTLDFSAQEPPLNFTQLRNEFRAPT
jgi:hypothetical protein